MSSVENVQLEGDVWRIRAPDGYAMQQYLTTSCPELLQVVSTVKWVPDYRVTYVEYIYGKYEFK